MSRCLLLFLLCAPAALAQVTFNHDIAPLVYTHCATCHHPGGIGPFALLSYKDVRKHASQIQTVTATRYMPPWPPEPGSGDFKGDRHLAPEQIKLIANWVQSGAPEGAGPAAAPPAYTNEWQMGKPDLVLRMPQAFPMPSDGPDLFRNFIIPANLTATQYIRGFELHLNNKRAVHHANVVLDRTQSLRRRDGEDGHPGFPGMDVTTEAAPNDFDPDSHFLFWKPASLLRPHPDDMSSPRDPGTDLILNLHLQPPGKTEAIQAEIALYFARTPPTKKPMLIQLEHDGALHIPPGDRNFVVEDHLTLPVAVDLLAIYPHAHYLGKVIEAWGVKPGGQRLTLIRIPDWDINWQATYEYRQPIFLPKGTTVWMRIHYDNSAANSRNPAHPPVPVEAGNRSQDEMGHVWLQVLPKDLPDREDPRLPLQEAAMNRRLQKYPADFLAHYNLGALLQSRQDLTGAADAYLAAIRLQTNSATARNSLGTIYMMQDRFDDAIRELKQATVLDPNYLNARFNLGRSLAAVANLPAAAAEYTAYLAARPDDAEAQQAIASVYLAQKQYAQAARHLREAAKTKPNDADLQANLGAAEAMAGNLTSAVQAFEAALRLDPSNATARQNLARARNHLTRTTH